MFRYVLMGTLVCYASCFTQISTLPVLKSRSVKDVCKMQKKDIDTRVFNDIDKDKSGSIDITELNSYYGKNNDILVFSYKKRDYKYFRLPYIIK